VNKKNSLIRQTVPISKQGQIGAGRHAGSEQAGQEYTLIMLESVAQKTQDRTKDNNPAGDKGKTGTIYRGGETGVRHETLTRRELLRAGAGNETIKETGVAEGR